jgi:hypothetical protein
MFKSSIAILAALLLALPVAAQAPPPGNVLTIQPGAPDTYTVQRGDTLWGIATKFLREPWRWPEIWRMNREQIANPHLIYPGDVVRFDRARGMLSIDRLSPRVREVSLAAEPIPSIPAKMIEAFLSQPLVVEQNALASAPRIVATQEGRYNLGQGSRAYAEGIPPSNVLLWHIYRPGIALVDPDNNQTLGYEAVYLGQARMLRQGAPSTLQIISSRREIGIDDKLVVAESAGVVNYVPHAPDKPIRARVMTIYDGRSDAYSMLSKRSRTGISSIYGEYDETGPLGIVSLNKGAADGLELGHVLSLHRSTTITNDRSIGPYYMGQPRTEPIQLPEERYGLIFVFRVFEHVSYALVVQAERAVSPKDVVQTP